MSSIPSSLGPRLESAAASDDSIQRVHAGLLGQKPEPEPGGYALAPLALLGLMSALILGCCIFFVRNRGGFDPLVYNGRIDPKSAANTSAALTPEKIIANGKAIYGLSCIQCHGPEGKGQPSLFPPLAGSDWANGSEDRVIRILLHGLKDPIKVKTVDSTLDFASSNKMPSLLAPPYGYSDAKISFVLTYVRQAFGNNAPPITAEKVTAVREEIAAHKGEFTQADLLAVP